MRLNREKFIAALQSVRAGLTSRETIEQSTHFVFRGGKVTTFNEEVCCSTTSDLGEDSLGAVQAKPVLELLYKLPDDEIEVEFTESEFTLKGKRKFAAYRLESQIFLPEDAVEQPKEWVALPEGFGEAVALACSCASTDDSRFALTCVHFHPEYVEACDNLQLLRYPLCLGITTPILIKASALSGLEKVDVQKFGVAANWLTFRSDSGLTYSCRRYAEDYPELGGIVAGGGTPITLPTGMELVVNRAKAAATSADDDKLDVSLKAGKVRIQSLSSRSRYWEVQDVDYDGPPLSFRISADVLASLGSHDGSAEVSESKLKVVTDRYSYVSCLTKVSKKVEAV